ncbi:hypothetical protein ABK040_016724 [Willaertia magna]
MQEKHKENMGTILEYIDQVSELAKEIEMLTTPETDEYQENKAEINRLETCVKNYINLLHVEKNHLKVLEQLGDTSDIPNVENRYEQLKSKHNKPKISTEEEFKKEDYYKQFHLGILRVHKPNAELNWGVQEDEDIVMTQEFIPIQCPYTKQYFTNPIQCKKCGHSYEKSNIIEMIKKEGCVDCPVAGCSVKNIRVSDLIEDAEMTHKIKKAIEKAQKEKEQEMQSAFELSDDEDE